jgi:hypothetical protein
MLLLLLVGSSGVSSLAVRAICVCWATFSAARWMVARDLERKQALLVYPIFCALSVLEPSSALPCSWC